MQLKELREKSIPELFMLAKKLKIDAENLKREDVLFEVLKTKHKKVKHLYRKGILEILQDGYGFLRTKTYTQNDNDVYVSPSQIRKFGLRTGDLMVGQIREANEGEKYSALLKIICINWLTTEESKKRPHFDNLIPLYPDDMFVLEHDPSEISTRVIDMFSPIGKGQRGLIVAPPKAGKTTLLKQIANGITINNPEIELMVLLIDERPEEVTDMKRSITGEVVSSTFDEPIQQHIRISRIILEKARRKVEMGADVVILLDSLTRLARAYNLASPSTGQTLSGGVNPAALGPPKRFFGTARNIENGGSLTIIATALVETGSRMDEVIFEEFKGTGNMELCLDRKIFEKRIFPAMDIKKSSTRKEELLFGNEKLEKIYALRRTLTNLGNTEATELLIKRLKTTKSNSEFLESIQTGD